MKILIHSNAPFVGTGYGSQTGLFSRLFRDAGHDVAISAFWGLQGTRLEWEGMPVYPADDEWGNKWLIAYAMHHGEGDIESVQIITLMDVWVLTQPLFAELPRLASWVPVDHDPVPPRVAEYFRRTGASAIAMSKFGQARLGDVGIDAMYVPHGVDTEILHPLDRADVRGAMGVSEDRFVVGMVAANKGTAPARKSFPEVFEAFARFHRRHSDALLYLHTPKESVSGINLVALADVMGLPVDALLFTPELELQLGVEYEKMAWVYSNMDVLLSPSYGEGFGIPIVEAQACGVPAIVSDFTAMPELVGPGWLVGGDRWYDASQGSWFHHPSVDAIVDALEQSYDGAASRKVACREFALGYDVHRVMEDHWVPTLEALQRPREVAPLVPFSPNRQMRRQAEKKAS